MTPKLSYPVRTYDDLIEIMSNEHSDKGPVNGDVPQLVPTPPDECGDSMDSLTSGADTDPVIGTNTKTLK